MLEIVIRPEGDLVDFHAWDNFAELLNTLTRASVKTITLDLASVNRMSSNYIGSIISNFKSAQESGQAMTLTNVRPKLFELLEMLKLTDIMPIRRADPL